MPEFNNAVIFSNCCFNFSIVDLLTLASSIYGLCVTFLFIIGYYMGKSRKESSCTRIRKYLISSYHASPVNFSTLTGLYYLDIPHLRGSFLTGRLSQVGNELGEEMKRAGNLAINHPSGMCYEYIAPTKILLLITKPEDIQQVMQLDRKGEVINKSRVLQAFGHVFGNNVFIAEGEEWTKQRKMYSDHFLKKGALKTLKPAMQSVIDKHIETLQDEKKESYTVELNQFCTDLAMTVIASTRMGAPDLDDYSLGQLQIAIAKAMREVTDYRNSVKITLSQKLQLSLPASIKNAKTQLHNEFIHYIVNDKQEQILQNANFLRIATANATNKCVDEVSVEDLKSDPAVCVGSFLLLAGHETTSKLIQFILMELSKHPEIVTEIRNEFSDVDINTLTADDLGNNFPNLNNVINEALRLYPPVPAFVREVMKDFLIGDVLVRKGTVIMISPQMTHQREDVAGAHPEQFNPDRWNKLINPGLYAPGAFIPFGAGARSCVGERFAIMEARLAISILVNQFDFKIETKPGQMPHVLFETRFEGTLKPAHDVLMSFRKRI